jgi:hypothetical protein|tara:strand:- start:8179 stop:8352 length:174 start_codon:yes stop_codon:yes gene_type:complete
MYQVLVKWMDKSVMDRMVTDKQLRGLIKNLKSGVTYAQVITPSGVTKEITNLFNQEV